MKHAIRRIGPSVAVAVASLSLATAAQSDRYAQFTSIHASEATPRNNSTAYDITGVIRVPPASGLVEFNAPVQLAHGDTIKTVTLEAHDESGGEFGGYVRATFVRHRYFSFGVITDCTTGIPDAPGDIRIPVSANNHVVDNSEYSYAVHIRMNNVGPAWESVMFCKLILELGRVSPIDVPLVSEPVILDQLQAVPNPSSDLFRLSYHADADTEVSGRVYDVSGRLVAELFSGLRKAGPHSLQWDGRDEHGARVASGTYVLAVTAGNETISRKVVLLK